MIFTRRLVLTTFLATGMFALTAFGTGPQTRAQTPVGEDSVTGSATFPVAFPSGSPAGHPLRDQDDHRRPQRSFGERIRAGKSSRGARPGGRLELPRNVSQCRRESSHRRSANLDPRGGVRPQRRGQRRGRRGSARSGTGPVALTQCPVPSPPGTGFLVVDGDFIVHDARPSPITSQQCRKGGWQNYPGFKNQGQCVAFVERGPRPGEPNGAG